MDKKSIISAVLLVLTASFFVYQSGSQKNLRDVFEEWSQEYGVMLNLSPEEMSYRLSVFEQNLKEINEHNGLLGKRFEKGVNKFTAYTKEEFAALYLTKMESISHYSPELEPTTPKVSLNVDWVSYGAVSPVKNQGSCLASYAFSAVGGIEGISAIYFKQQTQYSTQQIVDCSQSYGNSGCNSGNMVNSFNYVKAKGINSQAAYPYQGRLGSCQVSTGFFKISGYNNISSCSGLDAALTVRPVSVAVDGQNFQNYKSGIFDQCGTNVSLASLLVGGTDLYYKLKNCWGVTWGESGYIRILKTNNICGICGYGSYPLP